MAAPSSSLPLAASIRVEDQRYVLPPFSSNPPGDTEILERLLPLLALYHCIGQAGVNAGLPWWDPWDLPGMAPLEVEGEAKRREKYFVTDYSALKTSSTNPATPHGFWKPRDLGWGIPGEGIIGTARFAGVKRTYDFYTGETIYQEGIEGTNWIMDVYFLIDQKNGYVEDDLVMCHVFESKSHDYDPRPRCAAHAHHDQSLKEKEVYDQAVHAQSNISLFEGSATLLPTHINFKKPLSPPHHAPQRRCISHHKAPKENGSLTQHQELQLQNHSCHQYPGEPSHQAPHGQSNNSFNLRDSKFPPLSPLSIDCLENLANIMGNSCLQDSTETGNDKANEGGSSTTVSASADTGPLGKRTRTNKTKSPVWGKFTKLLTKAKAVLAVCNHCCKVMTGDSSKGTSHLIRHKCTCNCNH